MKKVQSFLLIATSVFSLVSCRKDQSLNPNDGNRTSDISQKAGSKNEVGNVYVLSNATAGNKVLLYSRSASGQLSWLNSYSTGGSGTGAGLGSQGAVIVDNSSQHLY